MGKDERERGHNHLHLFTGWSRLSRVLLILSAEMSLYMTEQKFLVVVEPTGKYQLRETRWGECESINGLLAWNCCSFKKKSPCHTLLNHCGLFILWQLNRFQNRFSPMNVVLLVCQIHCWQQNSRSLQYITHLLCNCM